MASENGRLLEQANRASLEREAMSRTTAERKGVPPEHDGAEKVGEHRVMRKSQWVPGQHPEAHKRHGTQSGYIEHYLECVDCGVEVLNKMDFPAECRN